MKLYEMTGNREPIQEPNMESKTDHDHLRGKVKLIFHYVYENFIDDYDWIYKGDDDPCAVM